MTAEQIKRLINTKIATYTRWKEQYEKERSDIYNTIKIKSAEYINEYMLKDCLEEIDKAQKKHLAAVEAIIALEWLLDDIEEAEGRKDNDD